ncbi:cell division protein FtsK [Parabacteroides sp. An277]|uniref:FtsK/SpoIIIE family DNA translocase n=1 Tax=Parabacteroides sp. An277 TaxID=1965619 RepID=UPI000B381941|nr:DNA translocase FtsK [Parabacteroides sp. An277]OUO53066.1 cell division protein FtsK [Parabacteroides sp. An277]
MVKKSTNKPDTMQKPGIGTIIKGFFTHERTRFITGLVISILTIYVGLALLSFFFTGAADQSKVENVSVGDLLANKGSVENWTGVRGAFIADWLMNRLFGVSSFMMIYFFGSLGARLMSIKRINLLNRFIFCLSTLIWGSWALAFFFIDGYKDTFLYLGGQQGYYVTEVLKDNIGIPGTFLLLLGFFLIIAIFSSKRTIPFLQRVLSFSWLGKIHLRRKKKEETIPANEPEATPEPTFVAPASPESEYVFDTEEEIKKAEEEATQEKKKEKEIEPMPEIPETEPEQPMPTPTPAPQETKGEETKNDSIIITRPEGDETDYSGEGLGDYDPRLDLSKYVFPTLDLLDPHDQGNVEVSLEDLKANQQQIRQVLDEFSIKIASIKATVGPTVTLYEIVPEAGIRIAKIKTLEDDIALKLAALNIRIIAPIPGKGTIGIEVPNKNPQVVSMQSVIASKKFQECKYDLPVAMGKTITNEVYMFDLCKAPHLLVAGATGQGKSVGLNAIITSLLYKKHPSELKFVMVDPKMVEFSIYSKIERHYLAKLPDADNPIVTEPADAVATLNSLVIEMENRYQLLVKANTRNIKEYNTKFISRQLNPENGHRFLPYIVAIVDEFADLIATSGREIELPISRIAAKARAVGIHMILATQRPDTKVITGTIKGNFPSRIAFKVASMVDSRTILDAPGANRLIGRGDMLIAISGYDTVRVQCAFVDTPEVEHIVDYIGEQVAYPTAYQLPEYSAEESEGGGHGNVVDLSDRDPLFDEAARLIVIQQQGSTSLIQRKFSIGYNRAGRLMDQLEAAGVVGPSEGSKARQVLIPDEYTLEQFLNDLK